MVIEQGFRPAERPKGLLFVLWKPSGRNDGGFGSCTAATLRGLSGRLPRRQSHVQPIFQAMQTKILLYAASIPAPMEVNGHPLEAVLAGNCLCLRTTRYATGGWGEGSTAPPVADEAVRSSNEAQSGDSACVPATLPNGGWQRCMLNFAAPRPLCHFFRGESRAIMMQSLARDAVSVKQNFS